jgi:hypothetical protein
MDNHGVGEEQPATAGLDADRAARIGIRGVGQPQTPGAQRVHGRRAELDPSSPVAVSRNVNVPSAAGAVNDAVTLSALVSVTGGPESWVKA